MSKTYAKIDRRSLLKNAALAAFLGPVVQRTMAKAQSPIKRLLVVFWPNGLNYAAAGPSGSLTNFSMGEYFQPLERHKEDAIALTGLHMGGVNYGQNTEYGHKSGGMACLTCTPDEKTDKATGPSVDQLIGRKLYEQGLAPMRRAPIFGVGASRIPTYGPVFHEDAGKVALTETEPLNAYSSLFSDVALSMGGDITKIIARRKSILDVALSDCKASLPALPAGGRVLLDYHCTQIRDLESSLKPDAQMPLCVPPKPALDMVSKLNTRDANNYPVLTDFFFKLLPVAFQCDLARVMSFTWGGTAARFNMPWLTIPLIARVDTGERNVRDHHSHTHAGSRQTIGQFMDWYSTKMAELLDNLKQQGPDGSSLLESMVVHYTTEYGSGGPHSNGNAAMFLFGSGGGHFPTGRLLTFKNDAKAHHALMVSLIQYMGVQGVDQFGHPMGGSGPLSQLQS